jgi:hypothetical protein
MSKGVRRVHSRRSEQDTVPRVLRRGPAAEPPPAEPLQLVTLVVAVRPATAGFEGDGELSAAVAQRINGLWLRLYGQMLQLQVLEAGRP